MTIVTWCSPFILLVSACWIIIIIIIKGIYIAQVRKGHKPTDADWLQRVSCRALIGWSLQRVTSLRHAVAAKVLLLGSAFLRLATYLYT